MHKVGVAWGGQLGWTPLTRPRAIIADFHPADLLTLSIFWYFSYFAILSALLREIIIDTQCPVEILRECSSSVSERKSVPRSSGAIPKQILKDIRRIGGFYAFVLGKSDNVELSVVARSNYEAVKSKVRLDR